MAAIKIINNLTKIDVFELMKILKITAISIDRIAALAIVVNKRIERIPMQSLLSLRLYSIMDKINMTMHPPVTFVVEKKPIVFASYLQE